VLLLGAALTLQSLSNLTKVDPGFDPHNLLTMRVSLPEARYPNEEQRIRFFDESLRRIRAVPGVEHAAVVTSLPVVEGGSQQPVVVEGQVSGPTSQLPEVAVREISPDYLATMKIPLIAGRDLTESDQPNTKLVVVIGQAMAKHFWPSENPIGKHLTLPFSPKEVWEVVGIVGDVKMAGLDQQPMRTLYKSMLQKPRPVGSFVVRSSLPPTALTSSVRAAIREVDRQMAVRGVASMDDRLRESLAPRRFNMLLLGAFAGLALLLSTVGIYSVLSYSVRRQVRDIGIRMALGAQVQDVLRMVFIEGMKPTAVGIAIGVMAAFGLHKLMSSLVFGVSANDPAMMIGSALLLGVVAVAASALPAYRATRVEPVSVLRDE
jgi:putative ABC transport system permease protein